MGGSSSSASENKTSNQDNRMAVADNGIGITGSSGVNVSTSSSAITTDYGSISAALKSNEEAARSAMSGVVATANSALAANVKVTGDAFSFSSGVSRDAMSLADRSLGYMNTTASDVMGMSSHIVDQAFSMNSEFKKGNDELNADAIQQVARAYDTATNYQAEKATTDSRYLVIAGLVVVGAVALKGLK